MVIFGTIKGMKIFSQKIINPLILVGLALIFFIGTASFNYLTQESDYVKWGSPDETANYYFSKKLAEEGELLYFEPATQLSEDLVMPRSMRTDAGLVKPVSFLGIILTYGFLGSIFGSQVIPFLTPALASLGIIFFYLLVKRVFRSKRLALISASLLATFPVYIYYTVRSLFHNVLFIVWLLIGAYLISLALGGKRRQSVWWELKNKFLSFKINKPRLKKLLAAFFGGVFIGLAIITRTSELIWLAPAGLILWLFYAKRFGLSRLLLFLAGLFLAFIPMLYWNSVLYDGAWRGGYNEMNNSLAELSAATGDTLIRPLASQLADYKQLAKTVFNNVFYFGFDKEQSILMFERYLVNMFPWLVGLAYLGIVILLAQNLKKWQKKYLAYLLFLGAVGGILVFYYGSWLFNDNPNPKSFTIGNSYTRYWLPIYLLLIPLAALSIERFSASLFSLGKRIKPRLTNILVAGSQAAIVLTIAAVNLNFVLFGSEEGLVYAYHNSLAEQALTRKVFALTDERGVIITQYYDKFFFPERKIIMGTIPNEQILRAAQGLVREYPVYYYNFYLDEAAVDYLNERKLPDYNLQIKLISKTNPQFGLYQLSNLESEGLELEGELVEEGK
jgi:4-amino-4-deoxy-L-arabinose transferase-like glycosyltransferase